MHGILLIQLRRFSIYADEKQHTLLHLNLYAGSPAGYQDLTEIDTVWTVPREHWGIMAKRSCL